MIQINKIYLGDCLEIMREIDDKSIDLILCDLPFNVLNKRSTWDVLIPLEILWSQYERIIKDNGAVILNAMEPFSSKLIMSNPKLFRYDLIWEKPLATGFLNANRMPLRSHEQILVFYKKLPVYHPQFEEGKPYTMTRRQDGVPLLYGEVKEIRHTTVSDGKRYPKSVLRFAADKEKLHPTQKPLALGKYLCLSYSNEKDIVLDNTCGSGTYLLAAKETGRNFIGIEKDERFYNIAKFRLGF